MGELTKQDYFTELDRRDQEQIIMEKRSRCIHCGKEGGRVYEHHFPLPRWLGGTETIILCSSDHVRYETMFMNFIKYGSFKPEYWCEPKNEKHVARRAQLDWQKRNHVHVAEYARKRYWANPEHYRAYQRQQLINNPEKVRATKRRWAHNNKDKIKEWNRIQRLRRKLKKEGLK